MTGKDIEMKRMVLLVLLTTCSRDDREPDPPTQVLVPCDPAAADGDPLACPADDAGIDASPGEQPDAGVSTGPTPNDVH